jgi:RsiW-degrading membrane proteinase PrsW (M82 family)
MNLLLMALAPVLAIALFVYWRDEHEKEPLRLLVGAFFLGVLGVVPTVLLSYWMEPWGLDEKSTSLTFSFISVMIGIALVEELSKFFGVRWLIYPHKEFNEPYDGIIYSVMAALGFAAVENILYVFEGGAGTAVARALFAVPGHAIDGVFIGYYLGTQKHDKKRGFEFIGLGAAILFHTVYDFLVFQAENYPIFIAYFLVSFGMAFRLALKAIKLHAADSPFHPNRKGRET